MARTIYFANTSKQNRDIWLRIPNIAQIYKCACPVGQTVVLFTTTATLSDTDQQGQIAAVIAQISKYAVPEDELKSERGMILGCYAFEAPPKIQSLTAIFKHNDEVQLKGADVRRKGMAAAAYVGLNEQAQQGGLNSRPTRVEAVFSEVPTRGNDDPAIGEQRLTVGGEPTREPRRLPRIGRQRKGA